MPIALIRAISLPNLKIYTTISLLLVSGCIYYAFNVTADPYWKLQHNSTVSNNHQSTLLKSSNDAVSTVASILTNTDLLSSLTAGKLPETQDEDGKLKAAESSIVVEKPLTDSILDNIFINESRPLSTHIKDIISFMSQEPICIWTLINMAYCCLILLGKSIQKIVFGELRISEQQHMKDKFWNFIFYKFIFVFGVVNVQYLHEVVLWVSWFSILGFLHLLAQLCKDRFEYLSFSPTTARWSHFRLIALLSAIFTISGFMIIVSIFIGFFNGINTFAFMAAECFILAVKTLHVLIRYGMFLYDMRQGAINTESISWDKRGPLSYYTEFGFDLASLAVDLMHHLHMLLWSNIFLSMASLVIIMQLRYLTNEIQRKFKKHRNYLWVLNHMEKSYPLATNDDLAQNSDNCAICWEKMETARKLPCSHLFHNSCLQSWLEQDTSCPTCRLALSVQNSQPQPNRPNTLNLDELDQIAGATVNNAAGGGAGIGGVRNNHFFHFNGSRYVSWLPNFSVEVSNLNNVLRNGHLTATINQLQQQQQTSQLRNMAIHIQEMFPRYPISTLMADLQITHSIELTIDNILEERLRPHIPFEDESPEGMSSTPSPYPAAVASDYYINADEFTASPTSTASSSPVDQNSLNRAYEIENSMHSIFGSRADLLRDDSTDSQQEDDYMPVTPVISERFSKSSEERERILQRRKEHMVAMARKKFLEKSKHELNVPTNNDLRHRLGHREAEM